MIRLFCSDFDGTLAHKGRVSKQNQAALQKLIASGVEFALVSGRVLSNLNHKREKYHIPGHVVALNGALVSEGGKHWLAAQPISTTVALDIIEECQIHKRFYYCYDHDVCYIPANRYRWLLTKPVLSILSRWLGVKIIASDHPRAYFQHGARAYKINVWPNPGEVEVLRKQYQENPAVYTTWSGKKVIELMDASVDKWEGIQHLAEALSIDPTDIATIGDYDNDLPMLKQAGYSFAMGNASEAVQQSAKQVVASVKEDGFAQAVEWILEHNAKEKAHV